LKIHGSSKNYWTRKDTKKNSIITTLSSLFCDHDPKNLVDLPIYKKIIVENLLRGKNLLVFGYSGSDKFDISPFLLHFKEIECLIWIDHCRTDECWMQQIEISGSQNKISEKLWNFLSNLKKNQPLMKIYYIHVETGKFIQLYSNALSPCENSISKEIAIADTEKNQLFSDWFKLQGYELSEPDKFLFIASLFRLLFEKNPESIVFLEKSIFLMEKLLEFEIYKNISVNPAIVLKKGEILNRLGNFYSIHYEKTKNNDILQYANVYYRKGLIFLWNYSGLVEFKQPFMDLLQSSFPNFVKDIKDSIYISFPNIEDQCKIDQMFLYIVRNFAYLLIDFNINPLLGLQILQNIISKCLNIMRKEEYGATLQEMGQYYISESDYIKAIHYLEQSLNIYSDERIQYYDNLIMILFDLELCNRMLGNMEKAVCFLKQLEPLQSVVNNPEYQDELRERKKKYC
jgi:tetratricopeptide (TPR) repeat protein